MESAPELWSLAQDGMTPNQLAGALMETDGLNALLNRVDWERPGEVLRDCEQSLGEVLENL